MEFSTSNLLTKKNLYKKIDSYNLFKAYCTNFDKINVSFRSDLPDRSKPDTNASCRITYIGGDLLYTDFGEGSYRAIPYIMRKYHLNYRNALKKINQDFGLGLIDEDGINYNRRNPSKSITPRSDLGQFKEKKPTIIDVRYSSWSKQDYLYWNQYGWNMQMLSRASIRPINFFWLTMEHKSIDKMPVNVSNELAFSLDFYRHEDVYRRKLYFPEREGASRFISNVDNTIVQNWDLLSKQGGDILFITSSKKDTGPFWRLNGFECNAIAPNNEISFIPEEVYFRKIKPLWKRRIVWLDNDETGIENALKWAKKYELEPIWNPLRAPKDPSDFVKENGLREFNYLKNKLVYG